MENAGGFFVILKIQVHRMCYPWTYPTFGQKPVALEAQRSLGEEVQGSKSLTRAIISEGV